MLDSTAVVDGVRFNEEDLAVFAKIPQTVKVRNHLIRFGSITDAEARDYYSISRLADVIYKLRYKREPRMNIWTEKISGHNKYGAPVNYGKYHYVEDK